MIPEGSVKVSVVGEIIDTINTIELTGWLLLLWSAVIVRGGVNDSFVRIYL
jgi:hypothetical protein